MTRGIRIGTAAAALAAGTLLSAPCVHAGAARFFASRAQCESSGLAVADCRTAFANALAEFSAKAPSFRSRRACFRDFGPCMPWPIGTHRYDEFRPQWIGVTVDGANVTPAVAPGHRRLEFAPQSTASLSPAAAVVPAAATPDAAEAPHPQIITPDDGETAAGPAGRAGGGFTMIDGVLTYPAPARFQVKALKRP